MTLPVGERSKTVLERFESWVRVVLVPGARLALWLLFYLSLLLGGWVVLGMTFGGWSPVVVTSGSMEPAVSVGDVLLVDTSPGNSVSQRSIILFERSDGTTVAHRVFSVEGDEVVTKGDANPGPDTDRVVIADVDGVARVLIPVVGLPAVWFEQGKLAPLIAWAILSFAGALHFLLTLIPSMRRSRTGEPEVIVAADDAGQVGIRRVRVLVGVLILAQFILEPARFDILGATDGRVPLLVGLLSVLAITNVLSGRIQKASWRRWLPVGELAADTMLVITLSALTGSSGLGWVLFALPIIEAAVRFGLVGALNHWMVLTTLTIATRIWSYEVRGTANLLEELEQTLDQMSVLFLVVVPGAYLAEQLIGDAADQRRALRRVTDRSNLLERVAESSRSVSQLDGQHISAVIEGTQRLGFDVVDLVAIGRSGWQKLGGAESWDIPKPGQEASGLRTEDLEHRSLLIAGDDEAEQAALDARGLSTVVTSVVAVTEIGRAVLRAGVHAGRTLTSGELDAFRLLAGQAAVALQNHELLSEITSIHGELEHQAHHDALTSLPNRVMMLERLVDAMSVDRRPVLMFLDLDGFKPVNDRLGHDAGDVLLQQVAQRLVEAVPDTATVARVGGDEFTILLRGEVDEEVATGIAERVAASIAEPFQISGDQVRIATSIGISFVEGDQAASEFIRQADVAMYVAKHGKSERSFEFFSAAFDLVEERRARLVIDIGEAISTRNVKVVYQPIVSSETEHSVVGVEALVRWTHPILGAIPPPDIVLAAEQAQLSAELHRHICFEAIRKSTHWVEQSGSLPFFLSINASPHDLASDHLVRNIRDATDACNMDPGRVFVEISEQLVSPDIPAVMHNIEALNAIGVRMLLDDFGEGQTSLSYIQQLPIAGIKLDRKLVVNALRSETDRIVIHSIVELCGRLDLLVIAEGVENAEHLAILEFIGCTLGQGYHLGMPEPAPLIDQLLERDRVNTGRVN